VASSRPVTSIARFEPRRVPPQDQAALARRHVGELLGALRQTRAAFARLVS